MLRQNRYLMVVEESRNRFPIDEYESIIEDAFSPPDISLSKVHEELYNFNNSVILTTNYDRLFEDAYAKRFKKFDSITFSAYSALCR